MMMNNEIELLKRIAALEQKVAKLQGKPAKAAPKSVPVEEDVRITYPAPTTSFVMPSLAELKQLLAIALTRLTQMRRRPEFSGPRAEEKKAEYFRQFCAAFYALGFITRADALDKKHAASYWIATAEEILRARKYGSVPELGPAFLAAVIAHDDIDYNDPNQFPYVLEFGLRDYGMGKAATDAWRRVLAAGMAPEPVEVVAPRGMEPSPSRVRLVG